MPGIFLTTNRLYLRQFTGKDLPLLMSLDSDPAVMRYVNGGVPLEEDFLRERVLPQLHNYNRQFSYLGYWSAHEVATDSFVGWFYILPKQGLDTAELGYRLKRSAWGIGYATEVSSALIAVVFREPDFSHVEATTMAANKGLDSCHGESWIAFC